MTHNPRRHPPVEPLRTPAEQRADKAITERCCDEWPECTHVLAAFEGLLDERSLQDPDLLARVGRLEEALRAVKPFVMVASDTYPQHVETLTEARRLMDAALAGVETGPGKEHAEAGGAGGADVEDGPPSGAPE